MTRQTRRPIVTSLSAFALGLLPAFFVAVSVFADAQWAERRFLMLAVVLAYGCLGFLAGWLSQSWRTALWLSLPALPALLLFGEAMAVALVYCTLIVTCATLGGGAGASARAGRRRSWS